MRKKITNAVFLGLNEISDKFKTFLRDTNRKSTGKFSVDFDDIFDEIRSYLQHDIVTMVLENTEIKSLLFGLVKDPKPIIPFVLNTMDTIQHNCDFILYVFAIAHETFYHGLPIQITNLLKHTDLNVLRQNKNHDLTFDEIDDVRSNIHLVKANVGYAYFQKRAIFRDTNMLRKAFHLAIDATHFSNILSKPPSAVEKDDSSSSDKKTDESNMSTGTEANDAKSIILELDTNREYSTEWTTFQRAMNDIINNKT